MRESKLGCGWVLLACLAAGACGAEDGGLDGGTGDGGPTGDPEILEFTASAEVIAPFETVVLTWRVRNARLVDVSTPDGTLVATLMQEGSVTTSPVGETVELTLTASNGDRRVTRTLTVAVDWPEPAIFDFQVSGVPFIGSTVSLQWQTRDADRSRLLADGVEIASVPLVPELGQGFANPLIEKEETTFTLIVSNPEHTTMMERVVTAGQPPELRRFVVMPRILLGRSTTATIAWDARGVTQTQLFVSGNQVQNFPGTLTGTITLPVTGLIDVRLVAISDFGSIEGYASITRADGEREPNDTMGEAMDISYPGGVQGSFASPTDVDHFLVFSYSMNRRFNLRVITTSQDGSQCGVDTHLILRDFAGRMLGESRGGGQPTGRGGACAVIDPAIHPFARDIEGRQAFIEVRTENGEQGSYALITDEL